MRNRTPQALLLGLVLVATSGAVKPVQVEMPATAASWVEPPAVEAAFERIRQTERALAMQAEIPIRNEADVQLMLDIARQQRELVHDAAPQSPAGSWLALGGMCRTQATRCYLQVAIAFRDWRYQPESIRDLDAVIVPLVAAAADRFPAMP